MSCWGSCQNKKQKNQHQREKISIRFNLLCVKSRDTRFRRRWVNISRYVQGIFLSIGTLIITITSMQQYNNRTLLPKTSHGAKNYGPIHVNRKMKGCCNNKISSTGFSSRWHLCTRKSPYALLTVPPKFPHCYLWSIYKVRLIGDGPLLQAHTIPSPHAPPSSLGCRHATTG